MLCVAPSSEYTVSDDYSAGAAGSSILKGSPRAWLLPFSTLLCIGTCSKDGFGCPLMGTGVLGHEMPQTRPSGVDFMRKKLLCSTACA